MSEFTKNQLRTIQKRIESTTDCNERKDWTTKHRRMRELYEGILWPGQNSANASEIDEHRVTVNLAQVNVDIIVSTVTAADPEFQVMPLDPDAADRAVLQKSALTKVWNEINGSHAQRRRFKTGVIGGLGVNFVGWRYEEEAGGPTEGKRPEGIPQEGDLPTLVMDGGELMAPPPEPEPDESLESINITYDNPTIRVVKPTQFYVDPDHDDWNDLTDARYVFEEKIVPLTAVKRNKNYRNTRDVRGDVRLTADNDEEKRNNKRDDDELLVKLVEYWQRDGRRHVVFADGQWDKPLLDEDWPYPFSTYPYTTFIFRDIQGGLPQGAVEPAESSVKSFNLYRTRQLNHDDKAARTFLGYDASKLTDDGKAAIKGDKIMPLVECNGSPSEVVQPIASPPLQQDFYLTQNGIKEDTNVIMAVTDYAKGDPGTTRRTLGEVQLTVSLSASRAQEVLRNYERACEKDANLILQLLQDERFCDRKRWMQMLGDDDEQQIPVEWDAESIKGRSDIRVVCNSTKVQTPESMQQTMAFALQSLAPYVQSGMIDVKPFIKRFAQSVNMSPTEIREAMNAGGGQGQEMQQGMEQMAQMLQQMGQVLQQTVEQVEQLTQQISANGVDAKTRIELEAKSQAIQQEAAQFAAEMQMSAEKHDQEMRIREAEASEKMRIQEENANLDRAIRSKQAEAQAKASKERGRQTGSAKP